MSDLSRLRAKWTRLDKRIGLLKAERDTLAALPLTGDKSRDRDRARALAELDKAHLDASATLIYVKRRVAYEEKRLLEPDTKLRFSGQ